MYTQHFSLRFFEIFKYIKNAFQLNESYAPGSQSVMSPTILPSSLFKPIRHFNLVLENQPSKKLHLAGVQGFQTKKYIKDLVSPKNGGKCSMDHRCNAPPNLYP
jgi:hypothetical protein